MSVRLSVCMSVCQNYGETWFSRPLYKIELSFFCAHSSCIWASILKIFCPSVCRSGYKKQKSFTTYGCYHPCLWDKSINKISKTYKIISCMYNYSSIFKHLWNPLKEFYFLIDWKYISKRRKVYLFPYRCNLSFQ